VRAGERFGVARGPDADLPVIVKEPCRALDTDWLYAVGAGGGLW
jgi:hypothetical protein